MSPLILGITTFFLHVLILKLAVSTMGVPRANNRYSKALILVLGLSAAGFIVAHLPLIGMLSWLIYPILWVAVMMSSYKLSFFKSVAVAFVQVGFKIVLWLLLKLFGVSILFSDLLNFGFN